jgi:hypothetical protein
MAPTIGPGPGDGFGRVKPLIPSLNAYEHGPELPIGDVMLVPHASANPTREVCRYRELAEILH